MELKFNSLAEVLEFANVVRQSAVNAEDMSPGRVGGKALVKDLARVATGPNNKIAAIKVYRAVIGSSLKEAKEAVETAPIFKPAPITTRDVFYGCGDPE